MGESPPTRMNVGEWAVIPARNLLERGGHSVHIKPRAMDVLVYLADHAGEVVSADALIDSVWRGRIVSDATVYQVIAQLRHALGETADEPRVIETIPKRGYRLIVPVAFASPDSNVPAARERVTARPEARWLVAAGAALAALALASMTLMRWTQPLDPSIAVLPFEDLGTAGESAHFADGMHSELLTQLAKIGSLKVISRTSVLGYAPGTRSLPQIGEELGVATVLEGTVQQLGDTLVVNVQLIDARTDEHLWAEVYERADTAQDLFAIQREVAMSIAQSLEAALTPQEIARLGRVPTRNSLAYDFYLSGNDYFNRHDDRRFMPLALQQYRRAVEEDTGFALAWAQLSRAHSLMHWYSIDRTPSRLELALEAAQRALQLDPDLPEAHLAMGQYYYQGLGNYEAALSEYAAAERGMAGSAELYQSRAMIFRRNGNWEGALQDLRRAVDLDPRNADLLAQQANTYLFHRDYADAEESIGRALDIEPDNAMAHSWQVFIPIFRDGDVAAARAIAEDPPVALGRWREYLGWRAALYDRQYDVALAYLDDWGVDVYAQNMFYVPKASFYAVTYSLAGEDDLAREHFMAARDRLEEALAQGEEDAPTYISLAEAMAGLGEREEALRLAHRGMDLLPPAEDSIAGPMMQLEAVVRVFAPLGEVEASIRALDACLAVPGVWWSIEGLLPDPRLDPIRHDPRFQALAEKYERP